MALMASTDASLVILNGKVQRYSVEDWLLLLLQVVSHYRKRYVMGGWSRVCGGPDNLCFYPDISLISLMSHPHCVHIPFPLAYPCLSSSSYPHLCPFLSIIHAHLSSLTHHHLKVLSFHRRSRLGYVYMYLS